jgi:hypothetical protein
MLLKYNEFINESLELILESNIIFSDRMKLALNKTDIPLAKTILSIENKDYPVASNYFDIPMDKNDKLSFIPDRKAQEILSDDKEYVKFTGSGGGWLKHKDSNNKLFTALGYTPESDEPYKPEPSDLGEVVSKIVSEQSGKTYVYVKFEGGKGVYNQEKLRMIDDRSEKVWKKSRQEINIGRAIRALLKSAKQEVIDKELEEFVNQFKSTIDKLNDKFSYFELVLGEDIGYWYNQRNYYERKGTLGNSCMASVPTSYFDIYMSNPDVCQLLILKSKEDTNKIVGRALLWTLRDGKKFLDRIYTNNDSDVNLFKDYSKENGWYVKYYNNSGNSGKAISPTGETVDLDATVDIRPGRYENYPYVDTLKNFNPKGTLSIKKTDDTYLLESTGGDYYSCEYCDGSGRRSCYECDGDGSWECSKCDGTGEVGEGEDASECSRCEGDGRINCSECSGDGILDCPECT